MSPDTASAATWAASGATRSGWRLSACPARLRSRRRGRGGSGGVGGAVRGGEAGRLLGVRGKSADGAGLLAPMGGRVVLRPAGDRARNEHAVDRPLKVGGADVLCAQRREPLADLFLVTVVQGIAAHDTQRDGLELGQLFFHLLIHAFIVGAIPVATQDRDRHSLARRDLESLPWLRLALRSGLRLESSHRT